MEMRNLGEERLGLADPYPLLEAREMRAMFVVGFECAYCYSAEGGQGPELAHKLRSFAAY